MKKFAKQDNSLGWRRKYSEMSTSYFYFCVYSPPTPPQQGPTLFLNLFQQIMKQVPRLQTCSGTDRAGWHIWAKITHNALNWIKQSRRIFYSWFQPGSSNVLAFPYSYMPRIPFLELHPRTFTDSMIIPKETVQL